LKKIKAKKHKLDRSFVSKEATKVLNGLTEAGFEAYLVGGAVRDALVDKKPKDFDIATSARPEEVKRIFKRSLIIGKRFKLVHVRFGREIIEVATFRSSVNSANENLTKHSDDGLIIRDNVYGTLKEDAQRRDFTINSMYYDLQENIILDFHKSYKDTLKSKIRLIGKPVIRYQEDPVRMLRAVRFMAKLDFEIEKKSAKPILEMSDLLLQIPVARLFEEYIKLFHSGNGLVTFRKLRDYKLFEYLFPQTHEMLNNDTDDFLLSFTETALQDTDIRVNSDQHVNVGYLLAVFLWGDFVHASNNLPKKMPPILAMNKAIAKILKNQRKNTSMPKKCSALVQDIWELQVRMQKTKGKSPLYVIGHLKYRAAFDFLKLRLRSGETDLAELVEWWENFANSNLEERYKLAGLELPKKDDE